MVRVNPQKHQKLLGIIFFRTYYSFLIIKKTFKKTYNILLLMVILQL